jgi:hypothetical protein
MWDSQSSCPGFFVCTAILCLDYNSLKYSFINITQCTPTPLHFPIDEQLISINDNYTQTQKQHLSNGFICSHCTRSDFIRKNSSRVNQCHKQITMIELKNYCQYYKRKKNTCQCFPSDQPIQPIKDWVKALVKPGKSHLNINRVKNINESAAISVYLLVGFVLLLVLFGGIIGIIFYWIKSKSVQRQILK